MNKRRDKPLPAPIRKPLTYIARTGYAARGTVYILIGVLAGASAAGIRADSNDTPGAMQLLDRSPLGSMLLIALAAGLAAYALWCFTRALLDPEQQAAGRWGWMRRVGFFLTGIVYVVIVFLALQTMMGWSRRNQGNRSARHWTATAMEYPLGRWAVAAVGAGFIGYMIGQLIAALRPANRDRLAMRQIHRRWIQWMIGFGMAARAIIFGLLGVFFIVAALSFDPEAARGLDGTFHALRAQPAGRWMLAVAAVGFVAYGAYDLVLAGYRVIHLDHPRR